MRSNIKKTIAMAMAICTITAGTIAPNAGRFILSATPIVAEAAQQGDFVFTRRSTNAATLTAYTGTASKVTLPTEVTINGANCKVTGIDDYAFRYNSNITSVTIPYGYTAIGANVFYYCTNLTTVSVPSSIVAIHDYAFASTNITSFTIPSKVKMLGSSVFENCGNLQTVNVNTNIITEMKANMFSGCYSLKTLKFSSGSKITSLGDHFAFGCSSLTSLTLPSKLTSIGKSAFEYCSSLSSMNFPSTVKFVGGLAFKDTKWIKNQSLTNGLVIKNGIIIDGTRASGTINIPNGITTIPAYMFSENKNITKVVCPNTLSYIGERAFQLCSNLKTVELSTNLSEIPDYCFNNCTSLKTIKLPYRVMNIGICSFNKCTSLKTINFPEYLKTIKKGAFLDCSALENITYILDYKTYDIADDAFEGCNALKKINGTQVATRSGYNVSLYKEKFVKQYFSRCEEVGFIQEFIDLKCSAVVEKIKAENPNYKPVQLARALEVWMCANGCSSRDKWMSENSGNYPQSEEHRQEYHRESSIFLNGVGVCEGYAKGYNRLLRKAGITCEVVASQNHAWNVIKSDGKWFNIDSYWDDYGKGSTYEWFMVCDKEMEKMDQKNAHKQYYVRRKENKYEPEAKRMECTTPMGDINGDTYLDSKDATVLQNYLTTGKTSGTFITTCADMNFDGKINATDLSLLKQKILNNK